MAKSKKAKLTLVESQAEKERKATLFDTIIDLMYQALPADTIPQIVGRINALTTPKGRYYVSQVHSAIAHLRSHADEYNWTIPHAKRGAGLIKNKYFAVRRDGDGCWIADPAFTELLYDGNRGTCSECKAKMANAAMALEMFGAGHCKGNPAMAKAIKRLARIQRHLVVELADLAEEFELNGHAA